MDIPLNADVSCTDGHGGKTSGVVINPLNREVTDVIVRTPGIHGVERLVPVDSITESTPQLVTLRLRRREVAAMQHFDAHQFVLVHPRNTQNALYAEHVDRRQATPGLEPEFVQGTVVMWPYESLLEDDTSVIIESYAPDALPVRRGFHVDASDGRIGQVDEFLVHPVTDQITHLVLREGHLWGRKRITIPVGHISSIDGQTVHLDLDRQEIAALPTVPAR